MRLIDNIMRSPVEQFYADDPERRFGVEGAGAFRELINKCPLRYVLDGAASAQCLDLVRNENLVPQSEDDLFLPPTDLFWFELLCLDPVDGRRAALRMGAIVEFDRTAQAGTLLPFGERDDGGADFLQCAVHFDWHGFGAPADDASRHRVRHAEWRAVDDLLGRARVQVSERWIRRCTHAGRSRNDAIQNVCQDVWSIFPTFVAWCAMLNSAHLIKERPSELARLNVTRGKRGKRPLLDHIEVGLNLTNASYASIPQSSGDAGGRRPPRLHLVRGHSVQRRGSKFWRSAHLRGEGETPLRRTVSVTAPRGHAIREADGGFAAR